MMGAWIPPQADRGVPWAREVANVMAGQPKTSRIPTGGWRSYGAVPSNTYASGGPIEGTPYWSGLGMVGSVYGAFGQDTKTENPCPAGYVLDANTGKCVKVAGETEGTAKPWLDMISALGTAAATAYQSHQQYEIQKDLIERGVAPVPAAPTLSQPAGGEPAMQAGNGGGVPTGLLIGGGLALAALAFVVMR